MDRETLHDVAKQTEVLRSPRQQLSTFGSTRINYFLLTEPVYEDLTGEPAGDNARETVVRKGLLSAARPQIVTPYYLLNLFQGFEHGKEFAQHLLTAYGANSPGLMYKYENELQETSIVADPLRVVAGRLMDQLDEKGEGLSAVVRGVDHLWDVSLMKFIFELTVQSLGTNVADLDRHGLLKGEGGLPAGVRRRLDEMFAAVRRGEIAGHELKAELDKWGVFAEYEDSFLDLFRR